MSDSSSSDQFSPVDGLEAEPEQDPQPEAEAEPWWQEVLDKLIAGEQSQRRLYCCHVGLFSEESTTLLLDHP